MSDKEIGENEQENIREEDVISSKQENLKYLREQGVEPYKYSYQRTININSLRRKYENIGETES
ncbi:MAG TPA: hypothetical protein PLF61_04135, partial [Candidatus Goldiibacteriota bacterium]|nr:hypothetical protein [Candidatus Goldiibacteriota bacterium]